MLDIQDLYSRLIAECKEGDLGLWAVIWQVRYALNDEDYPLPENDRADPAQVRQITMNLVRELLVSGQVQAGYYSPDGTGFEPWSLSPTEIILRINTEWDLLGREPNIGEIVILKEGK